ncbi:MAG: hypothetical protein H6Q90_4600 [Deltaproteobacteria bacterium]|nr:hypothetical protein [Deltaproteobacteria bacterium]
MRGPAVISVIMLVGCGLVPGPEGSPGPSTGNAPWRDLGTVQVCLGEQSFGPPASPPGGLCMRTTAEPVACAADAECDSREVCVCGRCTVAFCATASDCAAPRFCNFSQHRCDLACNPGTCASGETCLGGVCRERCVDSTDCQHGEVCDANVCIGDDCSDVTGCLAGERCDLQRLPQQVLEPDPIVVGGETVLYLDLAPPAAPDQRAIWRAVSRDGVRFTVDPPGPVVAEARAPSVVTDRGVTYLYFERGGELAVATSADGVTFDVPVTVLAGPDVHAPAAVLAADQLLVYYTRGGAIGLATGTLGEPLLDVGVVLTPGDAEVGDGTPGTAFWTPITELASPHAIVAGPAGASTVHLWFAGFGTESSPGESFGMPKEIPPNFSIGFASADLLDPGTLRVWPYGPVVDRIDAFLTHLDELGPAAIEPRSDTFRMYYIEASRDPTTATLQLGRLGVLGSGR